jgi:riboflavin kinase/FMN adenylyltransferase
MKIFDDIPPTGTIDAPVVTIGNFDGVHLGHRAIFDRVTSLAKETGGSSVVVTFRVHPRKILFPEKKLFLLSSLDEKIDQIGKSGIDALILLDFTPEISQMHAREFVRMILAGRMRAAHVVIGYDHAFGKNREGNIDSIASIASLCGFGVADLPPLEVDGHPVSSSRIRTDLEDGDVAEAARCLGRNYSVSGTVVKGFQRGRTIGFPTVNLLPDEPDKVIPSAGVYATMVTLPDGSSHNAVTSIGNNPTFGNSARSIESHILDFSGDLYDQKITLSFIRRLRDEKRFDSASLLVKAIEEDVENARRFFSSL